MFRFIPLVFLVLALGACSGADMRSSFTAKANAACSATGLNPSEAPFADCVRGLRQLSAAVTY